MKRLILALLVCANVAIAEPIIFLVRHAERADAGETNDPELSSTGRVRAESLARVLSDSEITAIYATEYKRTQQTAEPVSRATNLGVESVAGNDSAALIAKLKQAKGNVLVVGHSNTIPEILKALGAPNPVTIATNDYDNLFLVVPGSPAQIIRMHLPACD